MEEKVRAWPFMIGPSFAKEGRQLYAGFGFYWFKVAFFWNWHPHMVPDCQLRPCPWSGFVLAWKPNYSAKEGDLLWSKTKRWMFGD